MVRCQSCCLVWIQCLLAALSSQFLSFDSLSLRRRGLKMVLHLAIGGSLPVAQQAYIPRRASTKEIQHNIKGRYGTTGQVPSWIIAPPRSIGAWSRSGKDGNIAKITRRAGYGGVFTLLGRKHPRVGTGAKTQGEGRKRHKTATPLYQRC